MLLKCLLLECGVLVLSECWGDGNVDERWSIDAVIKLQCWCCWSA